MKISSSTGSDFEEIALMAHPDSNAPELLQLADDRVGRQGVQPAADAAAAFMVRAGRGYVITVAMGRQA